MIFLLQWLIFYHKILKAEHYALVSALLGSQIDQWEAHKNDPEDEGSSEDTVNPTPYTTPFLSTFQPGDHFILGSCQGSLTIKTLLEREVGDDAFTSFCARVSVAIKNINPINAIQIDESHKVYYI